MPKSVKRRFGTALYQVQRGTRPHRSKILKSFGGGAVLELLEDDEGGTFRAVYTVKFKDVVSVLHCFHKKSKKDSKTTPADINLIKARLKEAERQAEEMGNSDEENSKLKKT